MEEINLNLNYNLITLEITTTTGGNFSIQVNSDITVDNLKKIISKKLKVLKERICLISNEKELQDGTLIENGIVNGSRIIITPSIETGLSAQRAENTVMQALESLNDSQVNDFLSGKSPLNLSVRLGDHMMLIQLQLSTLSQSQQNTLKQKVANANSMKSSSTVASGSSMRRFSSTNMEMMTPIKRLKQATAINEHQLIEREESTSPVVAENDDSMNASAISDSPIDLEQSPIKSLSNLVSGPIKTSVQNLNRKNLFQPIYRSPTEPSTSAASDEICTDPISAKLTSCLCKRLNSTTSCNNNCEQSPSKSPMELEDHCYATSNEVTVVEPSQSRSFLNRTSNNAISKPKPKQIFKRTVRTTESSDADLNGPITTSIDNPALAEASRNLTQTLRRLSKRVFTNRINLSEDSSRVRQAPSSHSNPQLSASNSGAVIESMKHHGKGIYSGTFSGTLNPALQDKYGRPKRDISTIIHILNDLLSATPQVAKSSSAKIYFDSVSSGSSSGNSTQTTNNPASTSSTSSAPVPPITPNGKFVKIKKQSLMRVLQSSPCIPCNPNDCSEAGPSSTQQSSITKICTYGQCNGHSKIEPSLCARTSSSSSKNCYIYSNNLMGKSEARKLPDMPLISSGPSNSDGCIECNQNMLKLEIENSKTKHKLDQLRLVMQQKKERREARKLKASPYNGKVPIPPNGASPIQAAPKFNDNSTTNKNSINTTTTTTTTGSSTTATAIATPLTTNNETDLNHLAEEVDTAA